MNALRFDSKPIPRPRGSGSPSLLEADELDDVVRMMARLCATSGADRLTSMAWEQMHGGGKRLRARLALSAARILRVAGPDAVAWAAAVELLHNATLVHDDIQDGDTMRRGRPSLWSRHGVPQAINAGNYLLMLPYLALAQVASPHQGPLSAAIAEHAISTVRGQVAELDMLPSGRVDWPSYAAASSGKTGAMFALPIVGAAILAGRSAPDAAALGQPFVDLGLLFQMYDDVLDVFGDKGRELVASDLYEGKISALVVEHLDLHPADTSWMLDLLRTPREATPPASVAVAIDRFRSGGALAGVLERMNALATRVLDAPALAPEPGLRALARALVSRCSTPTSAVLEGVA